jgi:hypothetical protein
LIHLKKRFDKINKSVVFLVSLLVKVFKIIIKKMSSGRTVRGGDEQNNSKDIDRKIIIIQKSTRVSLQIFAKIHNNLRQKFSWYYKWHLWQFSSHAHSLVLVLFIIFSSFVSFSVINYKVAPAEASSLIVKSWATSAEMGEFVLQNATVKSVNGYGNMTISETTDIAAGTRITLPQTTQHPYRMTFDQSDNLYLVYAGGNYIRKVSPSGTLLLQFGSPGTGDGQFDYPGGIAVDSVGNIYVSDVNNHRIQKFDSGGNFIKKWGGAGVGDGQFNSPMDIALDTFNGTLVVMDTGHDRFQTFDLDGNFIRKWAVSKGTNNMAIDANGNIYNAYFGQIFKYDSLGNLISTMGTYGNWAQPDGGIGYIYDMKVDSSGNIYLVDIPDPYDYKDRLSKFSSNGTFIRKWTSPQGSGRNHSMAIDSVGKIYVAPDITYLYSFSTTGFFYNNGSPSTASITYDSGVDNTNWLSLSAVVDFPSSVGFKSKLRASNTDDPNDWVNKIWSNEDNLATFVGTGSVSTNFTSGDVIGRYAQIVFTLSSSDNTVSPTIESFHTNYYTDAPTITSITPSSAAVGDTITVTGTNFGNQGASTISIGGAFGSPVNWSDTSITLTVPVGANIGPGPCVVTTDVGSATYTFTVGNSQVVINPPTDLFLGTPTQYGFTANWTDNSTNETGFNIFFKEYDGNCADEANYLPTADTTALTDSTSNIFMDRGANIQYCAKIVATDGTNVSSPAYSSQLFTLAEHPNAPTLAIISSTSISIALSADRNQPLNTRYAIFNETLGKYVTTAGTLQAVEDWQLASAWGGTNGVVNSGLTAGMTYSYAVKAENGDFVPTDWSPSASVTTTALPLVSLKRVGQSSSSYIYDVPDVLKNQSNRIDFVVELSTKAALSDLTINLTYPGNGTRGVNFDAPSSVVIATGTNSVGFSVYAKDDGIITVTSTEAVEIASISPVGAAMIGSPSAETFIILDRLPEAVLWVDKTTINETDTTPVTVTATLTKEVNEDVIVDLAFPQSYGAILAQDYTISSTKIVIPSGTLSGAITINALNNQVTSIDRRVVVKIDNIVNAVINSYNQVEVTIKDSGALTEPQNVTIVTNNLGVKWFWDPAQNQSLIALHGVNLGFNVWIKATTSDDCSKVTYSGAGTFRSNYNPTYTNPAIFLSRFGSLSQPGTKYCAKVQTVRPPLTGIASNPVYSQPTYTVASKPSISSASGRFSENNGYLVSVDVNANGNSVSTDYKFMYSEDQNFTSSSETAWKKGTTLAVPELGSGTQLKSGTKYWIKVKAKAGNSAETDYSEAVSATTPLSSPKDVALTYDCSGNTIVSWSTDINASSYVISWPTKSKAVKNSSTAIKSPITLRTAAGSVYEISVAMKSNGETGQFSTPIDAMPKSNKVLQGRISVCKQPQAPTDFHGTAISSDTINWEWTYPQNSTRDELWFLGGFVVSPWRIGQSSATNYTETAGLKPNTPYLRSIEVKMFNGDSNKSNIAQVYTQAATPSITSVTKIVGDGNSLQMVFNGNIDNPTATKYAIKISDPSGSGWVGTDGKISSTRAEATFAGWNSGNVNIKNLIPNIEYSFTIIAVNGDGVDTPSISVSSKTDNIALGYEIEANIDSSSSAYGQIVYPSKMTVDSNGSATFQMKLTDNNYYPYVVDCPYADSTTKATAVSYCLAFPSSVGGKIWPIVSNGIAEYTLNNITTNHLVAFYLERAHKVSWGSIGSGTIAGNFVSPIGALLYSGDNYVIVKDGGNVSVTGTPEVSSGFKLGAVDAGGCAPNPDITSRSVTDQIKNTGKYKIDLTNIKQDCGVRYLYERATYNIEISAKSGSMPGQSFGAWLGTTLGDLITSLIDKYDVTKYVTDFFGKLISDSVLGGAYGNEAKEIVKLTVNDGSPFSYVVDVMLGKIVSPTFNEKISEINTQLIEKNMAGMNKALEDYGPIAVDGGAKAYLGQFAFDYTLPYDSKNNATDPAMIACQLPTIPAGTEEADIPKYIEYAKLCVQYKEANITFQKYNTTYDGLTTFGIQQCSTKGYLYASYLVTNLRPNFNNCVIKYCANPQNYSDEICQFKSWLDRNTTGFLTQVANLFGQKDPVVFTLALDYAKEFGDKLIKNSDGTPMSLELPKLVEASKFLSIRNNLNTLFSAVITTITDSLFGNDNKRKLALSLEGRFRSDPELQEDALNATFAQKGTTLDMGIIIPGTGTITVPAETPSSALQTISGNGKLSGFYIKNVTREATPNAYELKNSFDVFKQVVKDKLGKPLVDQIARAIVLTGGITSNPLSTGTFPQACPALDMVEYTKVLREVVVADIGADKEEIPRVSLIKKAIKTNDPTVRNTDSVQLCSPLLATGGLKEDGRDILVTYGVRQGDCNSSSTQKKVYIPAEALRAQMPCLVNYLSPDQLFMVDGYDGKKAQASLYRIESNHKVSFEFAFYGSAADYFDFLWLTIRNKIVDNVLTPITDLFVNDFWNKFVMDKENDRAARFQDFVENMPDIILSKTLIWATGNVPTQLSNGIVDLWKNSLWLKDPKLNPLVQYIFE